MLLLETKDEEGQIQALSAAVEVVIAFLIKNLKMSPSLPLLFCLLESCSDFDI